MRQEKFVGAPIAEVEPGLYRHMNGAVYEVLLTALDTDRNQETVVYRSTRGDERIYSTPLSHFLGAVSITRTREVPRFQRIEA